MSWYFWYSEEREKRDYEHYARALELGYLSALEIPRLNTALLSSNGETVEVRYNLASADKRDAYDSWGIRDLVYLGQGTCKQSRNMTHSEVLTRVQELGMIVPTVLYKQK